MSTREDAAATEGAGADPTVDPADLRASLRRFVTGVAVVAFESEGGRHGLTVNSFLSVSLDPPLVLVSIAHTASVYAQLADRPFSVNVLRAEQERLARFFADQSGGTEASWDEGVVAPTVAGALARFECVPWARYPGGDHTLYVGRVVANSHGDGDALGYAAGRYTRIPSHLIAPEETR